MYFFPLLKIIYTKNMRETIKMKRNKMNKKLQIKNKKKRKMRCHIFKFN